MDRAGTDGASRSVTRGIMRGLETGQLVPGQRLVETELAHRFGVGRNAVREAIQWLVAKSVVDATRHRSPALRILDADEAREVLTVAGPLIAIAARGAAGRGAGDALDPVIAALEAAGEGLAPGDFSRARRHFLRALLDASGNRELQRLFPSFGLHIFYAQYRGAAFQHLRLDDFRRIAAAVRAGDSDAASDAGAFHVDSLLAALAQMGPDRTVAGAA